jgi:hypothetical protein
LLDDVDDPLSSHPTLYRVLRGKAPLHPHLETDVGDEGGWFLCMDSEGDIVIRRLLG